MFLPEEDAPGAAHVVVLSDGFWKSHLGGAPDVVGRTLTLDGEAYTIVGVMPAALLDGVVERSPSATDVGAARATPTPSAPSATTTTIR